MIFSKSDICSAEYYSYYNICPAEVSLLDSILKRKEYNNTGKYVFPGIVYDCSLNWYDGF
ncbi:MAG: hypothetical protein EGQ86_07020 [Alistipes sp.]|nr:hypothetical protein [Alistipes sp.]MBE5686510.1 hypothetical protein [Alistipes sp.]MBE5687217.1 hypothetical protein [Alistipes sp.]